MYGAILGDMIGAPYEFDRGGKTKDFPLFVEESQFTDDTVMTIAVAEALMDTLGYGAKISKAVFALLRQRRYPSILCAVRLNALKVLLFLLWHKMISPHYGYPLHEIRCNYTK